MQANYKDTFLNPGNIRLLYKRRDIDQKISAYFQIFQPNNKKLYQDSKRNTS